MKENQKAIYYMAADSKAAAASAPFVERLVQKGYEVRVGVFWRALMGFPWVIYGYWEGGSIYMGESTFAALF